MRLLSLPELKSVKGIPHSRAHIHRLVKAGKFPAPIHISDNRIVWTEKSIDELVAERIAERDKGAA